MRVLPPSMKTLGAAVAMVPLLAAWCTTAPFRTLRTSSVRPRMRSMRASERLPRLMNSECRRHSHSTVTVRAQGDDAGAVGKSASPGEVQSEKMMKAISLEDSKPWDQLDFTPASLPVPTLKSGEILIKLKAAAINPVDMMVVDGTTKGMGWETPVPFTPGYDISGVVEAVGSDVESFKAGDEVFCVNWAADRGQPLGQHNDDLGTPGGAFAEYAAVPAEKVSKKDPNVSFENAAAVALVGTTAMQCLNLLKLSPGQRVLVLGGAGAVGNMAIQIAKASGYKVYTTASARTKEYVEKAGPDGIINYTEEKWEESEEMKGIDGIFDAIGEKDGFEKAKKVVKEGGSFVTIANFDPQLADPTAHGPLFRHAGFYVLKNNVKDQDTLMKMLVDENLKVTVGDKFELTKEGVTDLFKAQASGKSLGKNLLVF